MEKGSEDGAQKERKEKRECCWEGKGSLLPLQSFAIQVYFDVR